MKNSYAPRVPLSGIFERTRNPDLALLLSNPNRSRLGNLEQYSKLKSVSEIESTDKHIKNAVEYLFHHALEQRASDIHIEKRDRALVRLRIDGILHNTYAMPRVVRNAVISRIKALSRLDIAEKRRPQDGRLKLQSTERDVEIRVSTVPVAFGEKAVLRILNSSILFQDLESLGFSSYDLIQFHSFLEHPHGIILVTGPTGNAKYPQWLAIVFGGLNLVFTWVQKILSSKNPNAPLLTGTPSTILAYFGGALVVGIPYLSTQGIKFPTESLLTIIGVITNFIGADPGKNAQVVTANPQAVMAIAPKKSVKPVAAPVVAPKPVVAPAPKPVAPKPPVQTTTPPWK